MDIHSADEAQEALVNLNGLVTLDPQVAIQLIEKLRTVHEEQAKFESGAQGTLTPGEPDMASSHVDGHDVGHQTSSNIGDRDNGTQGAQRTVDANYEDDALGNRKRSHNDIITGSKKGGNKINGSLLPEWFPKAGQDPTPWAKLSQSIPSDSSLR